MIQPFQKQLAVFMLSAGIYFYHPFYLLQFWIVSSPVFENFLFRPIFYSIFGSKRFYDYTEATSAGFSFVELFQFDRIILLLLFYHVITRYRGQTGANRFDYCLLSLTTLLFVSCLSSNNGLHSLRYVFDTFLMFYLSFYIGKKFINTGQRLNSLFNAIIILGTILCASGLMEYKLRASGSGYGYFGPYRITGPFLSWESLAVTLSIVLFVTLYRISVMPQESMRKRKYLVILAGISVACIIMTGTRTTMAAVLVGFMIVFYLGKKILNKKLITWGVILSILCGILLIIGPLFITQSSFYTDTIKRDTAGDRIEQFNAAFEMLKSNPIFGIGFLNFKDYFESYVDVDSLQFSTAGRTTLHNSYLVIAVENGVITFLPLLLLIIYIFSYFYRKYKTTSNQNHQFLYIFVLCISFAYFSSAMTFDMFFAPPPNIFNKLYYLIIGAAMNQNSIHG